MSRTLIELAKAISCPDDHIENMVRRGLFRTPLAQTEKRRARGFSRLNAFEAAHLFYLVRSGVPGHEAGPISEAWARQADAGEDFAPLFAVNIETGVTLTFSDRSLSFVDLAVSLSTDDDGGYSGDSCTDFKPAASVAVIDRAEIARRINELFEKA